MRIIRHLPGLQNETISLKEFDFETEEDILKHESIQKVLKREPYIEEGKQNYKLVFTHINNEMVNLDCIGVDLILHDSIRIPVGYVFDYTRSFFNKVITKK